MRCTRTRVRLNNNLRSEISMRVEYNFIQRNVTTTTHARSYNKLQIQMPTRTHTQSIKKIREKNDRGERCMCGCVYNNV